MRKPFVLRIYDAQLFQQVKDRASADGVRENVIVERALYAYFATTTSPIVGTSPVQGLDELAPFTEQHFQEVLDEMVPADRSPASHEAAQRVEEAMSDTEFLTPGTAEKPWDHRQIPVRVDRGEDDLF